MIKKKSIKKITSLLMIFAMLVATGCSKKTNNDVETNKEVTEEAQKDDSKEVEATDEAKEDNASTGEITEIVVYRDNFNKPDDNATKAVEDEINKYIADKIGVKVKIYDIANSEYPTKLNLALAGGDEADLFWTASWQDTIDCKSLVKNNAVLDLTDTIKNYPTLYESMPEWVWQASSFDNRYYFIPCYKEAAEGYDIMVPNSVIDQFGWDLSKVTKLSDLTPFLKEAKDAGYGYPYTCQNYPMFERYYMDSFDFFTKYLGISKTGDCTKIMNLIDTPEFKEYCELMKSWADEGYINETEATKTTDTQICYGSDYAISWWTRIPDNEASASARYQFDVSLFPITKSWIGSNGTLGSCFAVNVNTKKADAVLKFLELLVTDPVVANLYTFGIEGVNYDIVDGKIQKSATNQSYVHDVWESTSIKAASLQVGEADDKVEQYDTFNNTATTSPALGFRFDTSNVTAEYAAVEAVAEEYTTTLECGFLDPETGIPEFLDQLNNAGLQKVMDEMQAQYDAWLASK